MQNKKLTHDELDILKDRMPTINFLKNKTINKNHDACDYYMAIPYGNKYLAWFTYYKHDYVCFFLKLSNYKIVDISIRPCCFNVSLSHNTIIYGTLKDNKIFFIEDIYYYKNKDVKMLTNKNKLNLFQHIFEFEINQTILNKDDIMFGMPIIKHNFNSLYIDKLPYDIYCIKHCKLNKNSLDNKNVKYERKTKAVFKVKPDIHDDTYSLYYNTDDSYTFYEKMLIPSYDCSIMMNNIFRNIKENKNIDYIEESESEDEFQDTDLYRFIKKELSYNMLCYYHNKKNKWIPISVTDKEAITKNKLFNIIN